jgi:AcrR family transcriptional regulator
VAKATLYNHFRAKDDVARALLEAELRRLTALAGQLPAGPALAALADELAGHPVLRRLRQDEPALLLRLLAVPADRWAELTARLAGALGVTVDDAELPARWLLGVVLQPGDPAGRSRAAGRLALALPG